MTARRTLANMLAEVAAGTLDALAAAPGLLVQAIEVDLPIEVAWHRAGDEIELLGDVPRTITRTVFDTPPARLHVVWAKREAS